MNDSKTTSAQPLYLVTREAASLLRVSEKHLRNLRVRGGGPPFSRLGEASKGVRYNRQALLDWAASRTAISTSAARELGLGV